MTRYKEAPTDPLLASFTPSDEERPRVLPTRDQATLLLHQTRTLCEASNLVQVASTRHQGHENLVEAARALEMAQHLIEEAQDLLTDYAWASK